MINHKTPKTPYQKNASDAEKEHASQQACHGPILPVQEYHFWQCSACSVKVAAE